MRPSLSLPATSSGRRGFIGAGALWIGAASVRWSLGGHLDVGDDVDFRLGLMTDLHYADKPAAGSRHYRRSLDKIAEAAEQLAARQLDAVVELGDFIDAAATVDAELSYLKRIDEAFRPIAERRAYVLGNHCVATLSKREFLDTVGQNSSYRSFDLAGWHFVVLDACFRSDGKPYDRGNFEWTDPNIDREQLEWLADDLRRHDAPTVVFVHQRLDVGQPYGIRNAADVRKILVDSGNVRTVLQGHSHKNDLKVLDEIPYCTLAAMVEGPTQEDNAYALLEGRPDGSLILSGYRQQSDRSWKA